MRLVPNGTFTGTLTEALRVRAWDQTEGVNGEVFVTEGRLGADHPFSTAAETITLEVLPYTNTAPTIAQIADQVTGEDTPLSIDLTVGDDGDVSSLIVTATTSDPTKLPGANLVVTGSGAARTLSLAPALNQFGPVTVTVTVTDGELSATKTFLLNITAVNDLPIISSVADLSIVEDSPGATIPFTVGDVETAAGALAVEVASDNDLLFPVDSLVMEGNGSARTLRAIPAANVSGTALITLVVRDADGATSVATFHLTVTPANDAPTISPIADHSAAANAAIGPLGFVVSDIDTALEAISISVSTDNAELVPISAIVITGTGADRSVTMTPVFNQSGTATITLTADDAQGGVSVETFTVTVAANTPPTLSDLANQTVDEDQPLEGMSITVGDVETDPNLLTVAVVASNPSLLESLAIDGNGATRSLRLSPAANKSGSSQITVTVTDINGAQTSKSFTITATPINDAPTIGLIANQTVEMNQSIGQLPFVLSDIDDPASELTLSVVSDNPTLLPESQISFGGTAENRFVIAQPTQHQSGTATITITVADRAGGSAVRSFTVTVLPNESPTIAEISDQVIDEDASLGPIQISVGDLETPSEELTLVVSSNNQALLPNSSVTLAGSDSIRTLVLTPAANSHGTVDVTLTLTDAHGLVATRTFTLTVNPVNDPPQAFPLSRAIEQDETHTGVLPGSDIDSTVTYSLATLPSKGTLAITDATTGAFTYIPSPGAHGIDEFEFRVSDGQVERFATVNIAIAKSVGSATVNANVLRITGTKYNDLIIVYSAEPGLVTVHLSGQRFGPFTAPEAILVDAGSGHDYVRIVGLGIPVEVAGGAGNDFLAGSLTDDILLGGDDDDVLVGGDGNDFLHGGDGDDLAHGGQGEDRIYGGDGDDNVDGAAGDDLLAGGEGSDLLRGSDGSDVLIGGFGIDDVNGGTGHDLLIGDGSSHDEVASLGDSNDTALLTLLQQWRAAKPAGLFDSLRVDDLSADSLTGGAGDDDFYASPDDALIDFGADELLGNDRVF